MEMNFGPFKASINGGLRLHTVIFAGAEEKTETVKLVVLKKTATFRPNLVITGAEAARSNQSLGEYTDSQIAKLKSLSGFVQYEREQVTCANGLPGILQHHAFQNQDGLQIEQLQLYFASADQGLIIATLSHLAGAPFQSMEGNFREMLSSFSLA